MQFYNSLSRKNEEFEPLQAGKINMYVCGLTPYDHAHLGHARTYVAFDMLKRLLSHKGYSVFHIQNITDVDDKIIRRCKESGAKPKELTERFHGEARELFGKLHITDADVYPKVTEHIPEIISIIRALEKNGYAYETDTGVYFEVKKFKGYGKLSGQKMDEILAGSRKEVDETKKNPEDFALWKKTKGEIIEFPSPWGTGRPGWHIECSAMAHKYAHRGVSGSESSVPQPGTRNWELDIHGGARDLIFPHHENEIAQSEAANGVQFVRYWLHTGFLTVNGEKMSKSLGNFVTLKDVLAEHSPNAVRMFFAMAHYRSPIDYNPDQIRQAESTVERVFNFMDNLDHALLQKEKKEAADRTLEMEARNKFKNFYHFLEADFDMPTAITYIFSLMKSANTHLEGEAYDYSALELVRSEMEKALSILGLEREVKKMEDKTRELVELLIELRDDARKRKDFESSDKIRDRLRKLGVALEDTDGKTKWKLQ